MSKKPEENWLSMWPVRFFLAGLAVVFLGWALQDVDRTTAMAPDTVIGAR